MNLLRPEDFENNYSYQAVMSKIYSYQAVMSNICFDFFQCSADFWKRRLKKKFKKKLQFQVFFGGIRAKALMWICVEWIKDTNDSPEINCEHEVLKKRSVSKS